MFSYTLILLASTILGSWADIDFFKNRRSNYNSNANDNEIYGGYDSGKGSDMDSGKIRTGLYEDNPIYDFVMRPDSARERTRGGLYDSPRYDLRGRGSSSGIGNEYDLAEDDGGYLGMYKLAGVCDENPKGFISEDDDGEDYKRSRVYRPYYPLRSENNLNSNANTNNIGSRNRRTSNWGARQKYGGALKYDRYGGYGSGQYQDNRDQRPSYGQGDQDFGLPARYQETYKAPAPPRYTTPLPYYIQNRDMNPDSIDEEDYTDSSQSDNNVNVNSNMNVLSRRSTVNANTNSNVYSRIRRSVNNSEESDRDDKITAETSTMADLESSTARVAEKREKSRGTRS